VCVSVWVVHVVNVVCNAYSCGFLSLTLLYFHTHHTTHYTARFGFDVRDEFTSPIGFCSPERLIYCMGRQIVLYSANDEKIDDLGGGGVGYVPQSMSFVTRDYWKDRPGKALAAHWKHIDWLTLLKRDWTNINPSEILRMSEKNAVLHDPFVRMSAFAFNTGPDILAIAEHNHERHPLVRVTVSWISLSVNSRKHMKLIDNAYSFTILIPSTNGNAKNNMQSMFGRPDTLQLANRRRLSLTGQTAGSVHHTPSSSTNSSFSSSSSSSSAAVAEASTGGNGHGAPRLNVSFSIKDAEVPPSLAAEPRADRGERGNIKEQDMAQDMEELNRRNVVRYYNFRTVTHMVFSEDGRYLLMHGDGPRYPLMLCDLYTKEDGDIDNRFLELLMKPRFLDHPLLTLCFRPGGSRREFITLDTETCTRWTFEEKSLGNWVLSATVLATTKVLRSPLEKFTDVCYSQADPDTVIVCSTTVVCVFYKNKLLQKHQLGEHTRQISNVVATHKGVLVAGLGCLAVFQFGDMGHALKIKKAAAGKNAVGSTQDQYIASLFRRKHVDLPMSRMEGGEAEGREREEGHT
jgi:hypothetical protein